MSRVKTSFENEYAIVDLVPDEREDGNGILGIMEIGPPGSDSSHWPTACIPLERMGLLWLRTQIDVTLGEEKHNGDSH